MCNGFSNCIDGSDEIGCGKQRNVYFIASLSNTLECNNRNFSSLIQVAVSYRLFLSEWRIIIWFNHALCNTVARKWIFLCSQKLIFPTNSYWFSQICIIFCMWLQWISSESQNVAAYVFVPLVSFSKKKKKNRQKTKHAWEKKFNLAMSFVIKKKVRS